MQRVTAVCSMMVFAVAVAVAGGCGGDDDASSDDPTPSTAVDTTSIADDDDDGTETSGVPRDEEDGFDVARALANATWGPMGLFDEQYEGEEWYTGFIRDNAFAFTISYDASGETTDYCEPLIALLNSFPNDIDEEIMVSRGTEGGSVSINDGVPCPDQDLPGHDNAVAATAPTDPEALAYRAADFLDEYFRDIWYDDTEAVVGSGIPQLVVALREGTADEHCADIRPYADFVMVDSSGAAVEYELVVDGTQCPAA